MKIASLISAVACSDIFYENVKVGQLKLSYSTYFEDLDDIHLTFPYRPMLRGKWEFQDYFNGNEWTSEKSFRICAEIGTEYDSEQFVESVRWYRTGAEGDEWKVQSLKSYSASESVLYGDFCRNIIDDPVFENEGRSEIEIVGESTFDPTNRSLSFEFTRPFDVQTDQALTLVGGFTFNIWTTWVIANSPDAVNSGRNRVNQYGNTAKENV